MYNMYNLRFETFIFPDRGDLYLGGSLPGGIFTWGDLYLGGSCLGGILAGGSYPGGSPPGGCCPLTARVYFRLERNLFDEVSHPSRRDARSKKIDS